MEFEFCIKKEIQIMKKVHRKNLGIAQNSNKKETSEEDETKASK